MRMLTAVLASTLALTGPVVAETMDDKFGEELKALRADVEALKAGEKADASDRKSAGLQVWAQLTGFYNQTVAAGDDGAGVPNNRANASAEVDLGLTGKPAEGMEANVVLRLNSGGQPESFDIWAEQALPFGLSLRGGFLDLTGIFDASAIANDEKAQFVRGEFVDSPVLGQGSNAIGLRLNWQAGEGLYVQAAVQDKGAKATNPFDGAFAIAEAGLKHGWLGGGELKVWSRESGRGLGGAVPAVGAVLDQDLPGGLKAFGRWAREFSATGLEHDANDAYVSAPLNGGGVSGSAAFQALSAGLELSSPLAVRPHDRVGAAWGRTRADDSSETSYAEAYYAWSLGENALLSLHYQADFSRLQSPVAHDWDNDSVTDDTTYVAKDNEHKVVGRVNLAF